jgi:hypothetical protein
MEVGRLSMKYGIDPPALVAMEHEIDSESKDDPMKSISNGTLVNSHSDNQSDNQSSQCECGSRNSFGSEISNDENKENPDRIIDETPLQIQLLGLAKTTSELGVQTDLSDSVDSGLLLGDDDHHQNNQGVEDEEPESTSELDVKVK